MVQRSAIAADEIALTATLSVCQPIQGEYSSVIVVDEN